VFSNNIKIHSFTDKVLEGGMWIAAEYWMLNAKWSEACFGPADFSFSVPTEPVDLADASHGLQKSGKWGKWGRARPPAEAAAPAVGAAALRGGPRGFRLSRS
jgi:hypothetical protein